MTPRAPRLLHPARPRLVDALRAIDALPKNEQAESFQCRQFTARGYVWSSVHAERTRWVPFPALSPGEAWDAFAAHGVIAAAWLDTDARWFVRANDEHGENLRRWWSATPFLAQAGQSQWDSERRPTSLSDAVAIASDPDGIAAAEALAREACSMMGLRPTRVVWRILRNEPLLKALQYRANYWSPPGSYRSMRPPSGNLGDAIVHMAAWPAGHVDDGRSPRAVLAPALFEAATNLLATGYALLAFAHDVVVLACPAIEWSDPT